MIAPAAQTRRASEFDQELRAHAALRNTFEPLYNDLSDHWTSIMQRLYPVWVLVAPAIADPAHIHLLSLTVMLDSEQLLGTREQLIAGTLERERILGAFGAAGHEVFHGKHTKLWIGEENRRISHEDPQLAADRMLLEEPRMEAHGLRDHPQSSRRGRFLARAIRAVVAQQLLPRFAQRTGMELALTGTVSRELCARVYVYLGARAAYGAVSAETLAPLQGVWETVLGQPDLRALDSLFGRVIWCPDGDSDQLSDLAREYRQIVGPPDEPPAPPADRQEQGEPGAGGRGGESRPGEDASQSAGSGGHHAGEDAGEHGGSSGDGEAGETDETDKATPRSLQDALEEAIERAAAAAANAAAEDPDIQATVDALKPGPGPARPATSTGGLHAGAPSDRLPDRGVDRPPFSDERQAARQFAQAMAKARAAGQHTISKRTPGGRLVMRRAIRALAERQAGLPGATAAWELPITRHTRLLEPHAILAIDTSGSMAGYEHELGPIGWELQEGYRLIGGRMALVAFGDLAHVIDDGRRPNRLVPGIRTQGGTAYAGDAIELGCQTLDMENLARPRTIYCVSDGIWQDTRQGVQKIRQLRALGVPTLHVAIARRPLSVEADDTIVVSSALEGMRAIAEHSVSLLSAQRRRRRAA